MCAQGPWRVPLSTTIAIIVVLAADRDLRKLVVKPQASVTTRAAAHATHVYKDSKQRCTIVAATNAQTEPIPAWSDGQPLAAPSCCP
jgi:organic hydroperoxide reductase OsmC/OhrA